METSRESLSETYELLTSFVPNLENPYGLGIDEFLLMNKNWILWEKRVNNNGLTILKKITS